VSTSLQTQARGARALRFFAVIQIRGINPYVAMSAVQANAVKPDWRRPLPVLVRINDAPAMPWRTNMMPAGDGGFYLYLHGEMRAASRSKVGDRIRVDVLFDASYEASPPQAMPTWFKDALAQHPVAAKNWRALAPSRKKEVLRYLSRLKSHEARARSLERALRVLSGHVGRFMARAWKDGR
jgi:hypothetical protein